MPEAQGARAPKPKKGKGSAVLIRVKQDTRKALEDEAERTGQSLSQTAEQWLDAARQGRADYLKRVGGHPAIASVIEKLAKIGQEVWKADRLRDDQRPTALIAAFERAIPQLIPPTPGSPAALAEALLYLGFIREVEKVGHALVALHKSNPTDAVVERARAPVSEGVPANLGGLFALGSFALVDGAPIWRILADPGDHKAQTIVTALRALKEAGDALDAEIDAAMQAGVPVIAYTQEQEQRREQAREIGHAIAVDAMDEIK